MQKIDAFQMRNINGGLHSAPFVALYWGTNHGPKVWDEMYRWNILAQNYCLIVAGCTG